MSLIKKLSVLCFLFTSIFANAWIEGRNEGITIESFTAWQNDSTKKTLVTFSDGIRCFILPEENNLQALLLALYMSNREVKYHCREDVVSVGGFTPSYRLHRIIGK